MRQNRQFVSLRRKAIIRYTTAGKSILSGFISFRCRMRVFPKYIDVSHYTKTTCVAFVSPAQNHVSTNFYRRHKRDAKVTLYKFYRNHEPDHFAWLNIHIDTCKMYLGNIRLLQLVC